jgi:hypothetical protein
MQIGIAENTRENKDELIEAHVRGIFAGAKAAARIARQMIESGWTDMAQLEAEIRRRMRTGKK